MGPDRPVGDWWKFLLVEDNHDQIIEVVNSIEEFWFAIVKLPPR